MSLTPLPTLDELAAHPERVQELSPRVATDLLAQVVSLQTVLLARALSAPTAKNSQGESTDDQLLTVEEAAQRLSTTPDWLYHHAKNLPFTKKLSPRQLRFSSKGIEKYLRNRPGQG